MKREQPVGGIGMFAQKPNALWTGILLALMVSTAGAALGQSCVPEPPGCPIGGYTNVACPIATDSVIRGTVASRLAGSASVPGAPICVSVVNGVVTLRGEVRDQSVQQLAVFLAGSVRGVACVNDQLTLSPATVMDLQLAVEVRNALDKFPSFRSRQMAVDVSEGVVRLSGIVNTEDERQQAGLTAESVRGVTAVHNNLVIKDVGYANY